MTEYNIVADNKKHLSQPPYSSLTASSSHKYRRGSSCQPEDGHLLSSKGWCAGTNDGEWSFMVIWAITNIADSHCMELSICVHHCGMWMYAAALCRDDLIKSRMCNWQKSFIATACIKVCSYYSELVANLLIWNTHNVSCMHKGYFTSCMTT